MIKRNLFDIPVEELQRYSKGEQLTSRKMNQAVNTLSRFRGIQSPKQIIPEFKPEATITPSVSTGLFYIGTDLQDSAKVLYELNTTTIRGNLKRTMPMDHEMILGLDGDKQTIVMVANEVSKITNEVIEDKLIAYRFNAATFQYLDEGFKITHFNTTAAAGDTNRLILSTISTFTIYDPMDDYKIIDVYNPQGSSGGNLFVNAVGIAGNVAWVSSNQFLRLVDLTTKKQIGTRKTIKVLEGTAAENLLSVEPDTFAVRDIGGSSTRCLVAITGKWNDAPPFNQIGGYLLEYKLRNGVIERTNTYMAPTEMPTAIGGSGV